MNEERSIIAQAHAVESPLPAKCGSEIIIHVEFAGRGAAVPVCFPTTFI